MISGDNQQLENTKVSFLLPAYKKEFLYQAIESILCQSYTNIELVIVNDKSPEDIGSVVASFSDDRMCYYVNEKNLGGENLVNQWNHCLQFASGEFVVLAADDDIYLPNFTSECLALTQKYPSVNIVRSRVEVINEAGKLVMSDAPIPEYWSQAGFVHGWLYNAIRICMGNYMFRTEPLRAKGFAYFPCAFGTDVITPLEMADHGMANTQDPLFKFRVSSIHLSSSKSRLKDKLEANIQFFKMLRDFQYVDDRTDEKDEYYRSRIDWDNLYPKWRYDCYNLVIKYLPLSKIGWIVRCELISAKDKFVMAMRFLRSKLK